MRAMLFASFSCNKSPDNRLAAWKVFVAVAEFVCPTTNKKTKINATITYAYDDGA